MNDFDENDIAIVGMGIRVAGANTPDEYWQNLLAGVKGVVQHSDEDLLATIRQGGPFSWKPESKKSEERKKESNHRR